MKFELIETVAVQDPELVLRVLEVHLQKVAGEVVRTEGQITAYGIGPSPRTVNRRDTTIFEGRPVEGSTVLTASVTYQASALLGNSPQDDIVRSKIEGAIDEMRAQLKVWKPWGAPPPINSNEIVRNNEPETQQYAQPSRPFETATESWGRPAITLPQDALPEATPMDVEGEPLITPLLDVPAPDAGKPSASSPVLAANLTPVESEHRAATSIAAATEVDVEPLKSIRRRSAIRTSGRAGSRSRIRLDNARLPATSSTAPLPANEANTAIASQPYVPLRGLLLGQGLVEASENTAPHRHGWKIALVSLGVLGLLGGAAFAMREQLPEPWKSTVTDWSSGVVQQSKKLLGLTPAAAKTPTIQTEKFAVQEPESSAIVPAPQLTVRPESNIYLWVQDWAAALRSRDPSAQASYYADTVAHYLEDTAVSKDSVLRALTSNVKNRGEVWNMKLEHVFIESQNATSARVRIIKHITATNSANTAVDQIIKLRLKLVRDGETWKIMEEQVLR